MADPCWYVTFQGRLTEDALKALSAAGIEPVGSHGGGSTAPGGIIPEMLNHRVSAWAPNAQAAVRLTEAALEGHGAFGAFVPEPRE